MKQQLVAYSASVLLKALWEASIEIDVEIEYQIDKITPKDCRIILSIIRTRTWVP